MAGHDNCSLSTFLYRLPTYENLSVELVHKIRIGDPAKVWSWSGRSAAYGHDKKTSIVTIPLVILRTSLNPRNRSLSLLNPHRSCRINTVIVLGLYILWSLPYILCLSFCGDNPATYPTTSSKSSCVDEALNWPLKTTHFLRNGSLVAYYIQPNLSNESNSCTPWLVILSGRAVHKRKV